MLKRFMLFVLVLTPLLLAGCGRQFCVGTAAYETPNPCGQAPAPGWSAQAPSLPDPPCVQPYRVPSYGCPPAYTCPDGRQPLF